MQLRNKTGGVNMSDEKYEKLCERFCDGYCKFPYICKTEDEFDSKCADCPICEMANEIERLEGVINNSLSVLEDDVKKLEAEVNHNYRAGISHAMAVIKEQSVKGDENADTSDKA